MYVFSQSVPLGEVVQKMHVESLYIECLKLAVSNELNPEDSAFCMWILGDFVHAFRLNSYTDSWVFVHPVGVRV